MRGLGAILQRAVSSTVGARRVERGTRAAAASLLPRCRMCGTTTSSKPGFGLLFDIDGVLVRGKTPIPAARRAFQKLLDPRGNFRVPVVFVTNAGNCLRQKKADQLSHLLGVQVSQEQVMLSHSPLRMFKKYHDRCVLVSGQGPVLDIANNLGFQNVVSIDQLREHYPLLDMVDHNRRPKLPSSLLQTLPNVEAVILFGEPIRWETHLQLVIDVLLSNGNLGSAYEPHHAAHMPLLACNMDLMWMAEAPSPRFGHGTFLVCLESLYRKITGRELKYEALMGKPSELTYHFAEYLVREQATQRGWDTTTLYAIGDNLMTDIYGANLYNRYLGQRRAARTAATKLVAQVTGAQVITAPPEDDLGSEASWESQLSAPTATHCHSILVCTGVYNPRAPLPSDQTSPVKETVFHGHRDFRFDPGLVEPGHIVEDVEAAVELVFQQEGFNP